MRALGIDVSATRGLDLALMEGEATEAELWWCARPEGVGGVLRHLWQVGRRPDLVAIDSPPAFGTVGRSRTAERALGALGVRSFAIPSDPERQRSRFYDWVRAGFAVFAQVEGMGYTRFPAPGPHDRWVLEVFPHASAVVFADRLPPSGWSRLGPTARRRWRLEALRRAAPALDPGTLRTLDQVDAALAALTGLRALTGDFTALGGDDGWMVLPRRDLPARFGRAPQEEARDPGARTGVEGGASGRGPEGERV